MCWCSNSYLLQRTTPMLIMFYKIKYVNVIICSSVLCILHLVILSDIRGFVVWWENCSKTVMTPCAKYEFVIKQEVTATYLQKYYNTNYFTHHPPPYFSRDGVQYPALMPQCMRLMYVGKCIFCIILYECVGCGDDNLLSLGAPLSGWYVIHNNTMHLICHHCHFALAIAALNC